MITIPVRPDTTVQQFQSTLWEQLKRKVKVLDRLGREAEPEIKLRQLHNGRLIASMKVEVPEAPTNRELKDLWFAEAGLSIALETEAKPKVTAPKTPTSKQKQAPKASPEVQKLNTEIEHLKAKNNVLNEALKIANQEIDALTKENQQLKNLIDAKVEAAPAKPVSPPTFNQVVENLISIRKVGNAYHFFVNNLYVERSYYQPLEGSKLGFFISGKQSVAFKNLTVSCINEDGTEEVVVEETFEDNARNWTLGDWEFNSRQIENGQHVFTCNNAKKAYKTEIDVPFLSTGSDFRIDCTTQHLDGDLEEFHYLLWGSAQDTYQFGISPSQHYRFLRFHDSAWEKIIPSTDCKAINA